MRFRALIVVASVALAPVSASAQFIGDYGGGWGPSLDTSIALGRDVLAIELGAKAGGQSTASRTPRQTPARTGRAAPGAFFAASAPPPVGPRPETRFTRSPAITRAVQADILAQLQERQPGAVAEYRAAFAKADWAKGFEAVTAAYRLSADDPVDTLTAYWVMAWIVANRAELPDPGKARAVRAQVLNAYAGSAVAGHDGAARQRIADQAIFNFLVLNAAWHNEARGPNAVALSDATQRNFLPLGGDLRRLDLTKDGFRLRS